LPGVPPGRTTVRAEVADVGRVKRSAAKEIVLSNGGTTDIALELSERTNVHGVVREGDKPVSRVVISLTPAGGGSSTRVVTDENGQYQVLGLTAGPYRIVTEGRPLLSSDAVAVEGDTKLDVSVGPAPPKSSDRPPGL
jgi:Carboxypeptidase regulatory-like domain